MVIIDDILISDDLFESHFVCDLSRCKGACCWEGDFGAPLTKEEKFMMPEIYLRIKHLLSKESQRLIEDEGYTSYYDKPKYDGTPLLKDGACAYLMYDEKGIAKCAMEKANNDGLIEFKKPISCHLYPVRAKENDLTDFSALNYDRWEICSAACTLGERLRVPLYQFVKDALIRKYGESFVKQMDLYYQNYHLQEGQ